MRKGKRKHLTNFNKNKKVAREASESYPPAEDFSATLVHWKKQVHQYEKSDQHNKCNV